MTRTDYSGVAVLIPCRNEAATAGKVVADFSRVLPGARVYVYDNASTDRTSAVAAAAGATVCFERLPGKGRVVRRMFADVEASIYVLVDGDDTYPADACPAMIDRLTAEKLDMVVAARADSDNGNAYRTGHRFGNRMLTWLAGLVFANRVTDMLSGYRVFSRRFVKSFPVSSKGFEIETELTIHALQLELPTAELTTAYGARPDGSESKLNTYWDGLRILIAIVRLYKNVRPFAFFGIISASLVCLSLALGIPVVVEFLLTGVVLHLPTALLATGVMLLGGLSLGVGMILDGVTRGRLDAKRIAYLAAGQ